MASEINKLMTRVSIVFFFVKLKFHEIMPHRLEEEKNINFDLTKKHTRNNATSIGGGKKY